MGLRAVLLVAQLAMGILFFPFKPLAMSRLPKDRGLTGSGTLHISVAHNLLSSLQEVIFLSVDALSSVWKVWPRGTATLHQCSPTFLCLLLFPSFSLSKAQTRAFYQISSKRTA